MISSLVDLRESSGHEYFGFSTRPEITHMQLSAILTLIHNSHREVDGTIANDVMLCCAHQCRWKIVQRGVVGGKSVGIRVGSARREIYT